MHKILLLLAMISMSSSLFADTGGNDPKFTFDAAAAAYNSATLPTKAQLTGWWVKIGEADAPNITGTAPAGWWPNAEFAIAGSEGYFQVQANISASAGSLNSLRVSMEESEVGAETDHNYWTKNYSGSTSSTEVQMNYSAKTPNCSDSLSCKQVAAQGLLICVEENKDSSSACQQKNGVVGSVMSYFAFTRPLGTSSGRPIGGGGSGSGGGRACSYTVCSTSADCCVGYCLPNLIAAGGAAGYCGPIE